MKTTALIVMVTATALLVSAASSQERGKASQDASAAKIKELQKERIRVLKDVSEVMPALLQRGTVTLEETCDTKAQLLRAEIEAAENETAQIKLYEEFVASMKGFEEIASVRKANALGTEADILRVRARRLEAEIALERVKAKAAK